MDDYISREKALNAILAERRNLLSLSMGGAEHILTKYGYNVIADLPAADVRPVVRAKWGIGNRVQPCSNCKYNGHKSWNFCPICGADMRGKEAGTDEP